MALIYKLTATSLIVVHLTYPKGENIIFYYFLSLYFLLLLLLKILMCNLGELGKYAHKQ